MNIFKRNTYLTTGAISLIALIAAVPELALAESTLTSVLQVISTLLSTLIPIVVTLAVVIFFWGLATFLLKAGDEKDKGRDIMIYGIVVLFVMVAVWGLVELLANTFDIRQGGTITLPTVGTGTQ
jgi:hypothetical protein